MKFLDPVSPRREGAIERAARLPSLDGLLIGLLHNGKHGGDELLFGLRDALGAVVAKPRFEYRRKPHAAAPAANLSSVFGRWQAAIVALGDCGSCSSWSVADSIELEKAGIPTVLIVSRPFVRMNEIEAKRLLMPDLAMIVVDHPIAQLPGDKLRVKGAAVLDQALEALTGSPVAQKAPVLAAIAGRPGQRRVAHG